MKLRLDLPPITGDRIAVHVGQGVVRQLRRGHPWVWGDSIDRLGDGGVAGDMAVVFGPDRKFCAIGLFDPDSPIAVRVLHQGAPTPVDDDFIVDRLTDSIGRRSALHTDPATNAYRLVHGENDQLPGLVIDRYDDVAVIRLDTIAWAPHLSPVVDALAALVEPRSIVLRASRRIIDRLAPIGDGAILAGDDIDGRIPFVEHGFEFTADVLSGQKTGHFLDQRDNRALVAQRCSGAHVLDVFSHTGGFSVHAAAAGARSVTSVDASRHAIAACTDHVERNRSMLGFGAEHFAIVDDAFDAMADLRRQRQRFDVVIVDPPSFASNQRSVPAARRAYRRLTSAAIALLGTGGTLFQASCSSRIDEQDFHDTVAQAIDDAGWKAVDAVRTNHALDHPIGFEHGAYLKALLADVVPR